MRIKKGIVTSSKCDKMVVVKVDDYKTHTKYKKKFKVSTKFYADDPQNTCKEGDPITIYESKPLSKLKRWTVVNPSQQN